MRAFSNSHADGKDQLPTGLGDQGIGQIGQHILGLLSEHRGDDIAPREARDGDHVVATGMAEVG